MAPLTSTIVAVIGYILGILLSFASVGGLLKALEDSLTFAMPVTIAPLYVIVGFVVVMLSYELSKLLCRRKVNAVSMSEALKVVRNKKVMWIMSVGYGFKN